MLPPGQPGAKCLLLGCGDGGERRYLEALGFETVGVDIRPSQGADVRADAHCLPLGDEVFEIVLSMQVLEHLHAPWIAVREIARVLRPGGWFVGSVAFLKPYHSSYFHMTHKGVRHLLSTAGLEIDRLAAAQSLTYSLYGGMVPFLSVRLRRLILGAVDGLVAGLRVGVWRLLRREDPDRPLERYREGVPLSFRAFDRLRVAPAVVFRARKSSQSGDSSDLR